MCNACGSDKHSRFTAEIAIHSPGLKGIDKPHVLVFPEILVCLNCGKTEFTIPEGELCVLAEGDGAKARRVTAGSGC